MLKRLISTLSLLHAINAEKTQLLLPSQQRLHKLRFLQKLGCQKPCWDQARLSSLVNKQVAPILPIVVYLYITYMDKLCRRLFLPPPDSSVWRWWAARTATSLGLARASVEISYLVLVLWSENELSNSLQLNQPRISWLL